MRRGSWTHGPIAALGCVLRSAAGSALLASSMLLGGCSLLIHLDHDQCEQDADCTKLGLAGPCSQGVCALISLPTCDGGTSCSHAVDPATATPCDPTHRCAKAGDVCFMGACASDVSVGPFVCGTTPAVGDSSMPIAVTTHVQEFVSAQPPKSLAVNACRGSDVNCTDPVASWLDNRGSGDVVLQLPYAFDGFFRISSDDTLTGLYFLTRPLTSSTRLKTFEVVAPGTLATLAAGTGYTADDQKGLVILEAFDCAGKAAGGIRFEESKTDALPFFLIDNAPNIDSPLSVRNDAQDSAIGGFLNASPGFTIFSARIGTSGPLLGRFNANVRANTVTYLDFHP